MTPYEKVKLLGKEAIEQGKSGLPMSGEIKRVRDAHLAKSGGESPFDALYQKGRALVSASKVDEGRNAHG